MMPVTAPGKRIPSDATSPKLVLQILLIVLLLSIPLVVSSRNELILPETLDTSLYEVNGDGVYLSLDEGSGQFAYDYSEERFPTEDSHEESFMLGASPEEDRHDPVWSSNTQFGKCLQFSEGDVMLSYKDRSIENGPFTINE